MAGEKGPAILGLKGKVQHLHMEMQDLRSKEGGNVTLRSHLARNYGDLTPEHLYAELEIDPRVLTVQNLMVMDEDTRWLFPEIIRDAILAGVVAEPVYQSLIAGEERIPQPSQVFPKLNLADAKPSKITEGATIEKGSVTWGQKTVPAFEYARGIDITYQAVQFCSLNLVSHFFTGLGLRLGALISRQAVTILINGDQDDGSEAAAVIGVEATSPGLQYKDICRAWIRMGLMGNTPGEMVTTETLALDVLELEEFKKRYQGTTDKTVNLRTPLPADQNLFVQVAVTANYLIIVNRARTMVMLVAQALMVESDKIIARRINEAVASIIAGFGILDRTARLAINTGVTYADNGFPTWFAPVE